MAKAKLSPVKDEEKKTESTAVAEAPKGGAVATTQSFAEKMKAQAGKGQENIDASIMTVPRFGIVQSGSPQRVPSKPKYINGAQEGQIFNDVAKQLFDGAKGIHVVPVAFHLVYLEWEAGNTGKLIKNWVYDSSGFDKCRQDKGKHYTEDGNEIVATAEYFVYMIDPETGATVPGTISMAHTSLNRAKDWNFLINSLEDLDPATNERSMAPIFGQAYHLKTAPVSNQQGNWFTWTITPFKRLGELPGANSLLDKCIAFRKSWEEGKVKGTEYESDAGSAAESDTDPM